MRTGLALECYLLAVTTTNSKARDMRCNLIESVLMRVLGQGFLSV
jgi:hypothetical protein